MSFEHLPAVVEAATDASFQAPGSPWSTIAGRVRVPLDLRLRECERAMRARISSKSGQNSLNLGPKLTKTSTPSRRQTIKK